ncbi:MAG: hypothetical protein IPH07_27605 [Deltaproteobacteria bacterium]|nr:hypothetical protein [Deltaproteobacteria bacterium]MBP7289288.1 hypothetical protein [Nannocystaceae bacterium]
MKVGFVVWSSASLLALAEDKVPNEAALPLGPSMGWWLLFAAVCAVVMFIVQADRWRRWWLAKEDPRSMALFRIAFAFFTICNINGLWEYFTFLFTDEGIFTADVARQVFASKQFEGFGDGMTDAEPWGFFGVSGFLHFLQGPKYSLLYFWDTPTAFWVHLWAFELVAFSFMIGFRTRLTGVLTFLLMNSLMQRNHLFWEGTELVYRCFLAYLILARSGEAYSVDNWLRCRKLRKQGLLSERGGPGGGAGLAPDDEHPKGLQAIYRLIPAWPRRLVILQLATIYTYTGIVKNGAVWAKGDAFYYALNMDHFYRFYPQPMSSVLGTNVMRMMTWVTHWWEVLFPLVVVGMVARWAIAERLPKLTGTRLWAVRACWAGIALASLMLCVVSWPVHFTPFAVEYFIGGWTAAMALLGWLWWRFANNPFRVSKLFGRKLSRTYVLDTRWFATWFLGRRVWLFLAIVFQSHVFFMMNVGHFQTGMLSACIPFLTGLEVAQILRGLGKRVHRLGVPMPADVIAGAPPLPAEDEQLPHLQRDTATLPTGAMLAALGLVVFGIVLRATTELTWWWWTWIGAAAMLFAVGLRERGRAAQDGRRTGADTPPWCYGPIGRLLMGSLLVWHVVGVATWLLPEKDCLKSFREPARGVWTKWLTITQTDQSWGMFAPNPPRSNVFLKVLVTDADGEVYDMRSDVYASERKPIPWIFNDRMRKMNRRIIGGESGPTEWYRKWYARYHCRQWALEHEGIAPTKVELVRITYKIPSPEQVRQHGWYSPEQVLEREGTETIEYTERCAGAIMGQLPDWIRERHGLTPLPEKQPYKPWIKHKRAAWDRKHAAQDDAATPE